MLSILKHCHEMNDMLLITVIHNCLDMLKIVSKHGKTCLNFIIVFVDATSATLVLPQSPPALLTTASMAADAIVSAMVITATITVNHQCCHHCSYYSVCFPWWHFWTFFNRIQQARGPHLAPAFQPWYDFYVWIPFLIPGTESISNFFFFLTDRNLWQIGTCDRSVLTRATLNEWERGQNMMKETGTGL